MHLVDEKSSLGRLLVFPFGLMALMGLVLIRFQPDLVLRLAHCPLRDMTGLPCPTCGGTHAAMALAEGRWTDAWTASPLVTLGLMGFGLWFLAGVVATVIPGLRRELVLTDREKKTARVLAVVLLAAGWFYQLQAG